MRLRTLLLPALLCSGSALVCAQLPATAANDDQRAAQHTGTDWDAIAPHLPDPQTATAKQLELAGDVLMARRFPEDALDYYLYAQQRGGDQLRLMKKEGVVHLELRQGTQARTLFAHCLRLSKKDAEAWNNLAATDYSMGDPRAAVGEYKRAIRFNKQSAVYHANLGMAYVELKDMESARTQFAAAVKLDPQIMTRRDNGGVTLRVLQSQDFAMLCFEMARMYAKQGDVAGMKVWLQKAGDRGMNVRQAMSNDSTLNVWLKNPDIKAMLANGESFQKKTARTPAPSLGTADPAAVPD
jgi:tetratricopeptide (TPR) repeat protein